MIRASAQRPKIDLVVEGRPGAHLATLDVVGQVVEQIEADIVLGFGQGRARDLLPGVIDRARIAIAVDEIEQGPADAFQHLGVRAQQRARGVGRLGAALDGVRIGLLGVLDAERHAVGRRAVVGAEVGDLTGRLFIDDQVHAALLVAGRGLGRVLAGGDEAQLLDQGLHGRRIGAGELDELEAVEAQGVLVGDEGHAGVSVCA